MRTECSEQKMLFQAHGSRAVAAEFDGGTITSDGGALLLRELELKQGIVSEFARCFTDQRDPEASEFTVEELLKQRVFGLALGYEDLNDHDRLRVDPLLATLCGRADPTGQDRRCASDKGKALAGKSTLNRLELHSGDPERDGAYKKIAVNEKQVEEFFVAHFLGAQREIPWRIYLDLDATDDRLHGNQEGRHFHGYYGDYCYLPLYIFCGDFLLCAKLRTADKEAADGALGEVQRVVAQIRRRWPQVEVVIRGDSGFCRDEIMTWCEQQQDVYYIFGLAQNARLLREIEKQMEQAQLRYEISGQAARVLTEFRYQTQKTWSCERRVIAKAEHLEKGANPRFIVTSLPEFEVNWKDEVTYLDARSLYEKIYCARGEMENRIKEQQLDLFADRTSTHWLKANQLRLWLASVGYLLLNEVRRIGLAGTKLARAYCGTIRAELFKIGARVLISVRRFKVSFTSAYPNQELFRLVWQRLRALGP
ncbi:MAG: IS1380 family transposase [Acidobacteria bacterium]|nr:IS1380 family transposase [Acidobacteriota bacterium]